MHASFGSTARHTASFVSEEVINGIHFKHTTDIDNGVKKESYTVNSKPVSAVDYEESLFAAEKEESKQLRRKNQDDRIKLYETQYKGKVKVAQNELKQALIDVDQELQRVHDKRITAFLIFSPTTIASAEQLSTIKDKTVPEAKKLSEGQPEALDIKKVQEMAVHLKELTPRLRETFITAVNNGINKADDTKLLKELLELL